MFIFFQSLQNWLYGYSCFNLYPCTVSAYLYMDNTHRLLTITHHNISFKIKIVYLVIKLLTANANLLSYTSGWTSISQSDARQLSSCPTLTSIPSTQTTSCLRATSCLTTRSRGVAESQALTHSWSSSPTSYRSWLTTYTTTNVRTRHGFCVTKYAGDKVEGVCGTCILFVFVKRRKNNVSLFQAAQYQL